MNSFKILFASPWLLLAYIPLIALALIPYFRLPKRHRRTRNRVTSLILHLIIILLTIPLAAGICFETEKTLDTFDVIILADVSDSNTASLSAMDEQIKKILNEENASNFRIGIVKFANGQVYASEASKNISNAYAEYVKSKDVEDTTATDISSALTFSANLLKEKEHGRLIVISDGLETDGNASTTARSLAEQGINVYGIYLPSNNTESEVLVKNIEVDKNSSLGVNTIISITMESNFSGTATITLCDNGVAFIENRTITLSGGTDRYAFSREFNSPGLHEITAEITSGTDKYAENNKYYAYTNIKTTSGILIVDGTGKESADLKNMLNSEYELTVVSPSGVPSTLEELSGYDEVILMNVDAETLPYGYDEILADYVYVYGGGLFTTGGTNTYALGNMEFTEFENILPLEIADDDELAMELMIVIDVSSSMDKTMFGTNKKRLDFAKQGAIESVNALSDSDYVGIVTFDANANTLVPISPATSRNDVIRKINGLTTGLGTVYSGALNTARSALFNSRNDVDKQHVIFITDGNPNGETQEDYESVLRAMASRGISVTTIAIIDPGNADDMGDINALKNRISSMARAASGNYYFVEDGSTLPQIMRTETEIHKRDLINTIGGIPQFCDYSPIIQGIERLPRIGGYLSMNAQSSATIPITIDGLPLYAEWNCGNGIVGSFTADLSGSQTNGYFSNSNGRTLISNIVKHLCRSSDLMEVEFTNKNYTTEISVKRSTNDVDKLYATITAPNGEKSETELIYTGSDYVGSFKTVQPGIYKINVRSSNASQTFSQQAYYAFSYSKEYDTFRSATEGYVILSDLTRNGNGRIFLQSEKIFDKESITIVKKYDPFIPFIITAIVLFLLDVAVRKFKFKWPHELIKGKKENPDNDMKA